MKRRSDPLAWLKARPSSPAPAWFPTAQARPQVWLPEPYRRPYRTLAHAGRRHAPLLPPKPRKSVGYLVADAVLWVIATPAGIGLALILGGGVLYQLGVKL